jgi:LPXTG-motif cell wall-anchored protein
MNEYTNYLQAAGGVAILVLLLVWVKKRNKK